MEMKGWKPYPCADMGNIGYNGVKLKLKQYAPDCDFRKRETAEFSEDGSTTYF